MDTQPDQPPGAHETDYPGVSVIMTVLNEERHLASAVRAVLEQDYPGELELVVALGPSTDRTDEIAAELVASDGRMRTVPNPAAATPVGLNLAIKDTRYDLIVRVDGHAVLPPDYVRVAVEVLLETGADHVGGESGPAETVYLGSFRRSALERVGGFDEAMRRAQDWELNYRLRRSGGTVWFTPRMRVAYRPRPNVAELARQYFKTGQWRREVVRRHRDTASLRYLAPPLALLGIVGGTVAGVAGFWPAFLLPGGYAAAIVAGSALIGRSLPWKSKVMLPAVCATMHTSWGAGFIFSPRDLK